MSTHEQAKKRARTDQSNDEDDHDCRKHPHDKALVVDVITKGSRGTTSSQSSTSTSPRAVISSPPPQLRHVYIVFTCQYPLHNDKWGEHSGHETEDTSVVGVYANLADANRCGRDMSEQYTDDNDSDDDEDDEEDEEELFYWQDEEHYEWTARRVWVEKQTVH
jgi:hypothetical protein